MIETTGHLEPSTWEQLACDELPRVQEQAAFEHIEGCEDCATTWAALRDMRSAAEAFDPYFQTPAATVSRFRAPRQYIPLAMAAMLTAALGLTLFQRIGPGAETAPGSTSPAHEVLRATDRAGSSMQPTPEVPAEGAVADVTLFSWQGAPAADHHAVDLLDGDGALLWQSGRLTDPSAAWPTEVEKTPGTYYWRVLAFENGQSTASDLVRFELPD